MSIFLCKAVNSGGEARPTAQQNEIGLVAAIVGKFAGAYIGARLSNLGRRDALILGASLNARGVVEVVIASA